MIVYIVTNKINGKQYVGQHCEDSLDNYWKRNIWFAMHDSTDKPYLYSAMRKHGPESFKIEALGIVETKEELDYYEKYLIKALNTKRPNGYNLTDGGDGNSGFKHSPESIQKMSDVKKGKKFSEEHKHKISVALTGNKNYINSPNFLNKKHFLGRKHSEETKQKMSFAQTGDKGNNYGKHASEETKQKMSIAHKGNTARLGKKHSEETKQKISASLRARQNPI
jgi:group I intron endonuclease